MDFAHMFRSMTAVGFAVIGVIVIMSIYSLWVMVERYIVFNKAKNQSLKLLGALSNPLTKGDYGQAIKSPEVQAEPPGEGHAAGLLEFEASRRTAQHQPRAGRRGRASGQDRTARSPSLS
jgi:hypothetical protein